MVGSAFDLQSDGYGERYNFLQAVDRQRCRGCLRTEKPWLVIGSPPCTWWSHMMALNIPKMTEQERLRRDTEADILLHSGDTSCTIIRRGRGLGRTRRWPGC